MKETYPLQKRKRWKFHHKGKRGSMVLVGKIRWIEKDICNTLREMAQKKWWSPFTVWRTNLIMSMKENWHFSKWTAGHLLSFLSSLLKQEIKPFIGDWHAANSINDRNSTAENPRFLPCSGCKRCSDSSLSTRFRPWEATTGNSYGKGSPWVITTILK